VEQLANALDERYPSYALDQGMNLQIGPGGVTEQPVLRHRFDSGAGWVVAITNEAVVLEGTSYEDIDDFVTRWTWLQEVVAPVLRLRRVTRLGLRYINQLSLREGPAEDALRWALDQHLLAAWEVVGGQPVASLTELRTRRDDAFLTLRHGLVSDGAYLLDFDHYIEEAQDPDIEAVVAHLRGFNDAIADAFRRSVTDEQWAAFEPEDDR
jgi:uncharacterized protein (TIGR04255 family)